MTIGMAPRSRRWFLRTVTGAALAVVATGTQALLGASPALAQSSSCCLLQSENNPWCPLLCAEQNQNIRCWACNNGRCMCCECSTGDDCFSNITMCSYQVGCCS